MCEDAPVPDEEECKGRAGEGCFGKGMQAPKRTLLCVDEHKVHTLFVVLVGLTRLLMFCLCEPFFFAAPIF